MGRECSTEGVAEPAARRRGQAAIEAGLAASGLRHTLLRSHAYMQNFLALAHRRRRPRPGPPARSFRDFAAEHAGAFAPAG